jgi:(S)-ureidoglycine aminohydrolase
MKLIYHILLSFLPVATFAQGDSILSGIYHWKDPEVKMNKYLFSKLLFAGKTVDMQSLEMTANELRSSGKRHRMKVPANQERLLIIKSGTLTVSLNDSLSQLGPGSIVLLMAGERYMLSNKENEKALFYSMNYTSKAPVDLPRGKQHGGSFIRNWSNLVFQPHDRGGVRNYFQQPTAMCKRFEMHVTTLKEGIKSHEPHTHRAEEIVLVIDNKTEMQIGAKFYKGNKGDIYYLGSNVSHAIRNDGKGDCIYFAYQFE